MPDQAHQKTISIGACNGTFDLKNILKETYTSVNDFLNDEEKILDGELYDAERINSGKQENAWIVNKEKISKSKMFVDFQNDVTAKDIKTALSEGFRSIEHVKRYTTNGMATDQGKTSNVNADRKSVV